MKRLAAIISILALAACMAFVGQQPRVTTAVSVRADAAAVWVIYSVSATASPDSVQVTASATGQPSQMKPFVGASKKDSVSFLHPAEGATVSGSVSPKAWKRGNWFNGAGKPWSYTEPVVPPTATVDSVRVTPTSATLAPGGSVLLTARVYRS